MYVFASWLVSNVMMIDDPLDAGAVHCFCGAWGLIVASAFAHKPFVAQVYGDETAAMGHGTLSALQLPCVSGLAKAMHVLHALGRPAVCTMHVATCGLCHLYRLRVTVW